MDITAIQEIRWTGEGIIDKKNHTVFYSCDRKHHMFGTGFIVNKRIKHLVQTLKPKHLEYIKYGSEDYFLTTASSVYMHQQKKNMMMKRKTSMKIWIRCMRSAEKDM